MLQLIAILSLAVAIVCALIIAADELRHPQHMPIMNVVWPATALYLSIFGLYAYFKLGRKMTAEEMPSMDHKASQNPNPTWTRAALADTHCGSGCALADIVVEFTVFALGLTLFSSELYASYLWDFVGAWCLGIVFQYLTIKPMRDLSPSQALWAAIKADTFSILAFQIGMYLWMALVFFKLFPSPHLHPSQPAYWLMMQIGMICGFLTALPMNWILVRLKLKEPMA